MNARLPLLLLALSASACVGPTRALEAPSPPTRLQAPGGASVSHVEGAFTAPDGLKLFRRSWRPEAGAPRAAVVVVHGLRDHSARYGELGLVLASRGLAVHAFDLRGHGRSEGVRVWVDPFTQYLDDLDAFVKLVAQEEPGVPVFLLGFSMGGGIVTLDALTRKPPVAGLVVLGGALTRKNVSGFLAGSTRLASALFPHLDAFSLDPAQFSRDPAVVEQNRTDPYIFQDAAPARTAAGLLGALEEITAHRSELTLPLLALHGTTDVVTPPDGSKELVAEARSPDKTLKLYDGFAHDLLHEPAHAQVLADIVSWLEAHARR